MGVASAADKMGKAKLKLLERVKRRSADAPIMRCERLVVARIRKGRGRPKKT